MKFHNVIGLEEVKEKLVSSVRNGKVSHAILFSAAEGGGGLPLALAFAQYLNCSDRQENDSCGKCPSCHKMEKMIHPDVHFSFPFIRREKDKEKVITSDDFITQWRTAVLENPYLDYVEWLEKLDAENKQGNIPVAECHKIIKNLTFKAFEGRFKVIIMWLPELLGKYGNTLLKIIEEPPENSVFIFVTHNKDLILNTILSRTQQVMLPPLALQAVADQLVKQFGLNLDEAVRVAGLSAGNYAEAIRIVNSGSQGQSKEFVDWLRLSWKNDGVGIYKWVSDFSGKGREYHKNFLLHGQRVIRESLLLKNNTKNLSHLMDDEVKFSTDLSAFLEPGKAVKIYELLNKSHYYIERNINQKILFFSLSLQLNKILRS